MNSRERVLSAINHIEPDGLPLDLGATPSSGISAIAYDNLLRHLPLKDKRIWVYDVVQQVAQPSDEVLDYFRIDTVDIGRTFNTQDGDWYDYILPNGTKAAMTAFQYEPAFAASGIEVSSITMPLSERIYVFPNLPERTFYGLPGLLADSLPDRFGNALIDAWLATQGRTPESFNAVERLCYTGARGMGALEFVPALGPKPQTAKKIEIDALVKLASEILGQRKTLRASFASDRRKNALNDLLRVGTSAGGARAKAAGGIS